MGKAKSFGTFGGGAGHKTFQVVCNYHRTNLVFTSSEALITRYMIVAKCEPNPRDSEVIADKGTAAQQTATRIKIDGTFVKPPHPPVYQVHTHKGFCLQLRPTVAHCPNPTLFWLR